MGTSSGLAFDQLAVSRRIAELGRDVSRAVLEASQALYAPFHEREPYTGVRLSRDVAYGPHERHCLDVFAPAEATAGDGRPVLAFVHGGSFVGGDKHRPDTPYNDNVALWATRHGFVGVNLTYRLAPQFPWPAGAEDVASALTWLRRNIAAHGGHADRLYLMGTSAGAVHVASYISHRQFQPDEGVGLAGAILVSGMYDLTTFDPVLLRPYFGADRTRYAERSSLPALVADEVPTLFVLAEFDSPAAERQTLDLVNTYWHRHGRWPRFLRLLGHNHFSTTLHLGSPDDTLGRSLLRFVDETTGHERTGRHDTNG